MIFRPLITVRIGVFEYVEMRSRYGYIFEQVELFNIHLPYFARYPNTTRRPIIILRITPTLKILDVFKLYTMNVIVLASSYLVCKALYMIAIGENEPYIQLKIYIQTVHYYIFDC